MSFGELERIVAAAKALQGGVLDSDPTAQWYESTRAFGFVLDAALVWTEAALVRANPAANIATAQANAAGPLAGVIADYSLAANAIRMTPVPGVNNTYVALQTYGDFSTWMYGWLKPPFAPQATGVPSVGYTARLFNGDPDAGGTEILTTDGTTGTGINKSVGWVFNYDNGLLMLADDFAVADPYITGFHYIGGTATSAYLADTSRVFIFRPGGPTEGSYYSDWVEMMDDVLLVDGPRKVIVDDTYISPVTIPVGSWNMTDVSLEGYSTRLTQVLCRVSAGASLTNLRRLANNINIYSLGAPPAIVLESGDKMELENNAIMTASPLSPLVSVIGTTGPAYFDMKHGSGSSGANPVIDASVSGSSIFLFLGQGCSCLETSLSGVAGSSGIAVIVAASATWDDPKSFWSGSAWFVVNSEEAQYVEFDPSITGHLTATDTQAAIDELSFGGSLIFVYQPGGTAAGNVYTDWAAMMTAIGAAPPGKKTLRIDDSFTSPALIPAGAWDITDTTLKGSNPPGTTPRTEVEIQDGATLPGMSIVEDLKIVGNSTSWSVQGTGYRLLFRSTELQVLPGQSPIFELSDNTVIELVDGSRTSGVEGVFRMWGTCQIRLYRDVVVAQDTVENAGFPFQVASFSLFRDATCTFGTQSNFSYLPSPYPDTMLDDSANVRYTDLGALGGVDNVQDAIDALVGQRGSQPSRVILVDPDEGAVIGERYPNWVGADAYVTAQSPSASSRWVIKITGTNAENIVVRPWVSIVGEEGQTFLTGSITSTATYVGPTADTTEASVIGCTISNLSLTGASLLRADRCVLSGGSPSGGALFAHDCIFTDPFDGKSLAVERLFGGKVLGGDHLFDMEASWTNFLDNFTLAGGVYRFCRLGNAGSATYGPGLYTINNCDVTAALSPNSGAWNINSMATEFLGAVTVTGGSTFRAVACAFGASASVAEAGSVIETNCCTKLGGGTLVNVTAPGTWTNRGSSYNNATSGLTATNTQAAIDELVTTNSRSYQTAFTDASLVTGVLTVTHNLGQQFNHVAVYDNLLVKRDVTTAPRVVTGVNGNTLTIDFSGWTPLTGQWTVVVST